MTKPSDSKPPRQSEKYQRAYVVEQKATGEWVISALRPNRPAISVTSRKDDALQRVDKAMRGHTGPVIVFGPKGHIVETRIYDGELVQVRGKRQGIKSAPDPDLQLSFMGAPHFVSIKDVMPPPKNPSKRKDK